MGFSLNREITWIKHQNPFIVVSFDCSEIIRNHWNVWIIFLCPLLDFALNYFCLLAHHSTFYCPAAFWPFFGILFVWVPLVRKERQRLCYCLSVLLSVSAAMWVGASSARLQEVSTPREKYQHVNSFVLTCAFPAMTTQNVCFSPCVQSLCYAKLINTWKWQFL